MKQQTGNALTYFLVFVCIIVATVGAWLTHVIVCIQDEKWLFLIAGALFFPIAMIHGWGVWLGVW